MPECIVCKGYYEVGQPCKDAEQRRREAEQRCKEAEQRRREAEQRCKEAEQSCREAEQGGEEVEQRCKKAKQRYEKAKQRCRKAKQRYEEAKQRCKKAMQHYKEAEQRRKEAEQRCEKTKQPCERCGSDSSGWEKWKREEEALGPGGTLWRFLEPYFGLPLLIAGWALIFGLLGMLWPWGGIRPPVLVLAIVLTFVGCVLAAIDVHGKRFDLREQELLRRVKRGRQKGIGLEMQTLLVPGIALILAMLLTTSIVQSKTVWKLMEWLVLEDTTTTEGALGEDAPPSQEEPGLKERIKRAFPLTCLSGYVTLAAFAYSSSLMLAREYARRLSEKVPHPIFLQDEKLAQIVRREAEVELGRLDPESTNVSLMRYVQFKGQVDPQFLLPSVAGGGPLSPQVALWGQAATWVWDELVRTDDGGIEMKVARHEIYQLPRPTDKSDHRPHPRVRYVVRADPWGRVIKIARTVAEAPK